jgi:hypothetical protein
MASDASIMSIDVAGLTQAVVTAVERAIAQSGGQGGGVHPPIHGGDIKMQVSFYVGSQSSIVAESGSPKAQNRA